MVRCDIIITIFINIIFKYYTLGFYKGNRFSNRIIGILYRNTINITLFGGNEFPKITQQTITYLLICNTTVLMIFKCAFIPL